MKKINNRQKMTHRQKQRLARRNVTKAEMYEKVGIFETQFWEDRKQTIRERVKKTELNRHSAKFLKEGNKSRKDNIGA